MAIGDAGDQDTAQLAKRVRGEQERMGKYLSAELQCLVRDGVKARGCGSEADGSACAAQIRMVESVYGAGEGWSSRSVRVADF